ncbi:MAG: hypothetical protein AAB019_03370 [Planctomycetota bacterium]
MRSTTLVDVANAVNLDMKLVRNILTEKPGLWVGKEMMDQVFQAARKLQYDFKKLKIGKRMNLRKEVLAELLQQVKKHPRWGRKQIIEHLKKSQELLERVHRRTFLQEFTE